MPETSTVAEVRKRFSDSIMEEESQRLSHDTFQMVMGQEGKPTIVEGLQCLSQEETLDSSFSSSKFMQVHSELSHLLSSKYIHLAFCLPPTCTSIWNVVEEDINSLAENMLEPGTKNTHEVLSFLRHFFSESLVQNMCDNFSLLEGSYLGLQYTLRMGVVALGEATINDLIDVHVCNHGPLHNFLGACEGQVPDSFMLAGAEDDWKTPRKTFRSNKGKSGEGSGGVGGGSGGGGAGRKKGSDDGGGAGGGGTDGAGGSGGGEGGDEGSSGGGFEWTGLSDVVEVELSQFETPTKGQPGRKDIILLRSGEFAGHGSVEKPQYFYDPWVLAEVQEKVFLYHGTCKKHLKSFKQKGISPPMKRNEFCALPAFYTSNSLRYAYEHPLHNHPSQKMDHVSVLVFEVDVRVLHGERAALGMAKPFLVKWFKADTKENIDEWADFSLKNLKQQLRAHKFDIVIGPVCLPNGAMDHVEKLVRFADGVELTQIAFCSLGSREWLEKCAIKVYCEKRVKK